jgi:hypothetical protein
MQLLSCTNLFAIIFAGVGWWEGLAVVERELVGFLKVKIFS